MPDLPDLRLRSHRLVTPAASLVDAARWMAATQAQDFWAGRFALALRTADHRGAAVTRQDVDAAFDRGELIRSWTMRGTLHIVDPADLPLFLAATGDRMRRAVAPRHRELGLDEQVRSTAERLLRGALAGGDALTRAEVFAVLDAGGIDPTGQRGYHLIGGLAVDGVLCWGPVVDRPGAVTREQRLVLVEHWCPPAPAERPDAEAAAAELFARYVAGHGPVTAADFAWWLGVPLGAARRAQHAALHGPARHRLRVIDVDGTEMVVATPDAAMSTAPPTSASAGEVIALPPFDEYYLSYGDRSRVCAPEHQAAVGPGRNGMVRGVLVADGRVIGTWRAEGPTAELFPGVREADAAVARALRRVTTFRAGSADRSG